MTQILTDRQVVAQLPKWSRKLIRRGIASDTCLPVAYRHYRVAGTPLRTYLTVRFLWGVDGRDVRRLCEELGDKQVEPLKCKAHPKYRGVKEPLVDCPECREVRRAHLRYKQTYPGGRR